MLCIDAAYCYIHSIPHSMVLCLYKCLFPCWAHGWAVQKTGEPIDVQFGETHVDHWNHVLGGVPIPLGKGIFGVGGKAQYPSNAWIIRSLCMLNITTDDMQQWSGLLPLLVWPLVPFTNSKPIHIGHWSLSLQNHLRQCIAVASHV